MHKLACKNNLMDKYKLYHKQFDSNSIKIEQQPVYVGCSKEINCHNQLPTVPSQCGGKQTSGRSDLLINIQSALILLTPRNQPFWTISTKCYKSGTFYIRSVAFCNPAMRRPIMIGCLLIALIRLSSLIN